MNKKKPVTKKYAPTPAGILAGKKCGYTFYCKSGDGTFKEVPKFVGWKPIGHNVITKAGDIYIKPFGKMGCYSPITGRVVGEYYPKTVGVNFATSHGVNASWCLYRRDPPPQAYNSKTQKLEDAPDLHWWYPIGWNEATRMGDAFTRPFLHCGDGKMHCVEMIIKNNWGKSFRQIDKTSCETSGYVIYRPYPKPVEAPVAAPVTSASSDVASINLGVNADQAVWKELEGGATIMLRFDVVIMSPNGGTPGLPCGKSFVVGSFWEGNKFSACWDPCKYCQLFRRISPTGQFRSMGNKIYSERLPLP